MSLVRTRSADLVNHNTLKKWDATIIGVGAIGSNLAYLLAKMGIGQLVLYDDDRVEAHNIEPQMYTTHQLDMNKVDACQFMCQYFVSNGLTINPLLQRVSRAHGFWTDIVVSCVDSIESRKEIARALMLGGKKWSHFIDGRMGGNIVELHYATPDTMRDYWDELVQVEPLDIPCSGRAVAYNGMFIASLIARQIAALTMDQPILRKATIDLLAWSFVGSLQVRPDVI